MIVRRTASVVFGLLAVSATRARSQDENPTLIGIVRSDGVMLPFAKFDGRRWLPFPSRGEDSSYHAPQTFDLPKQWTIHFANGSRRRSVQGGASGDAINASVTAFAERDARSAFWLVNRRKIEIEFRRAADTLAPNVEQVRLRQLHVARQDVDGAQLFYVDVIGLRRSAGTKRDCAPAVYYQAWIRRRPDDHNAEFRIVHEAIEAGADCDSPGAEPTTHTPMGLLQLGSRRFVAVEHTFYEGGNRQLFELTRTSLTPAHPVVSP